MSTKKMITFNYLLQQTQNSDTMLVSDNITKTLKPNQLNEVKKMLNHRGILMLNKGKHTFTINKSSSKLITTENDTHIVRMYVGNQNNPIILPTESK